MTTTCAEADQAVVLSTLSMSRKRNLAQFLESDEEQDQDTTSQDRQQQTLDEKGVPTKRAKGKGKPGKHRNKPLLFEMLHGTIMFIFGNNEKGHKYENTPKYSYLFGSCYIMANIM